MDQPERRCGSATYAFGRYPTITKTGTPLTGSPATAGSPSSPKGAQGGGLLLSWTGGEAWFIHRTTWMTLVATKDSVLGGVVSGDRKGRSGKDKPNGLNVLTINNISHGWEKQTQARYVSRYQRLRAKNGGVLAKFE